MGGVRQSRLYKRLVLHRDLGVQVWNWRRAGRIDISMQTWPGTLRRRTAEVGIIGVVFSSVTIMTLIVSIFIVMVQSRIAREGRRKDWIGGALFFFIFFNFYSDYYYYYY